MSFLEKYLSVRKHTETLMQPLQKEDFLGQPILEVSPPKWHLGHTTWFFETLILRKYVSGYQEFNSRFPFYFNSYYESLGERINRNLRGNLTRPSLDEVYAYRKHVDKSMIALLEKCNDPEVLSVVELGCNHEQQHQELFLTDFKYILWAQPFYPVYSKDFKEYHSLETEKANWINFDQGVYEIGHQGSDFSFDNESPRHKVYLTDFKISSKLVSNKDWMEFIEADGYKTVAYWHSEGWDWINNNNITAPEYWFKKDEKWLRFALSGLEEIKPNEAVSHISYYEAYAFAEWKGMRLPTEAEWEIANQSFNWGQRWEWTNSAYLPYPGFKTLEGPAGEYNGKFMVNQMVLRGASVATPKDHSRKTYRNFFHPHLRWQFTGLRLAQ